MLIHSCCADCFLKLYQTLNKEQQLACQIFYNNPNIYPREEHGARLQALKKVVKSLDQEIEIIVSDYLPQQYFLALAKLNNKKEKRENKHEQNLFTIIPKKERCSLCWELRLRALFALAKKQKITCVTSTLLSSNYQNLNKITEIAQTLSQEYQIEFYIPQLQQIDREKPNTGFYKQNYCGCLYSLLEKSREKYQI